MFDNLKPKTAIEHGIQGLLDSFGIDVDAIKTEIPKFLAMAEALKNQAPLFVHGIETRVVNMETRIVNVEKYLEAICKHLEIKAVDGLRDVGQLPLAVVHDVEKVSETAIHDTETVAHDVAVDTETVADDAARPVLHAGEDIFQSL